MPSLFNREVDTYRVDVFESSTLDYNRSIRLLLKPSGGSPAHTVSIEFPSALPADYIDIGNAFSTVRMTAARFEQVYEILKTESPVFFTAYEFGNLRFVGVTTDPEATGEGFRDGDTAAA